MSERVVKRFNWNRESGDINVNIGLHTHITSGAPEHNFSANNVNLTVVQSAEIMQEDCSVSVRQWKLLAKIFLQ